MTEQGAVGHRGTLTAREVAERPMPAMERAVAIMRLLRSAEGCPWDREQTFDTIKRHTLEEVYEVFDAIERRSWGELRDELGDLLLQVLFYAQMASDAGYFGIDEVAQALNEKLIRRHPHVFGAAEAANAGDVLRRWDEIKQEERAGRETRGLLEEVPRGMPAVMEAQKLGSRAGKVGFDWEDARGLLVKMREELAEVDSELMRDDEGRRAALEEEIGDVLFTAVNLARHLEVDAEGALRGANAKFRRRFGAMERELPGGVARERLQPEVWEELWDRVKEQEGGAGE